MAKMTVGQMRELLEAGGFTVESEERLGNDTGTQLRLEESAVVNVYDKGTYLVQGKNKTAVQKAIEPAKIAESSPAYGSTRKVFVVYGHDQTARTQLEAMLRRWGLEPLILDQLPTSGQTVIEKLEAALSDCDFGVVLATPDDEGHRTGHEDERAYRARQNVVLELGMLLSKLGRENVAILLKSQQNMERPSDIQGLIYIPFTDDVAKDAGVSLAKSMAKRGYKIDIAKL